MNNSNRSSNQGQGKAKGKNRSKKSKNLPKESKQTRNRQRTNLTAPGPRGALQLHSAQTDVAMSTFFRFSSSQGGRGAVIEGRDLCATLPAATSAAGAFTVQAIAANVLSGAMCSRWQTYGSLFTKWRARKLKATFVAGLGTGTAGFNYIAWDMTQTNINDPTSASALMRFEGSAMGVAYANIQSTFPLVGQLSWYDTQGSAVPTNTLGQLFIGSTGYTSAVSPGQLVIDYELEFIEPF